MNEYEIEVEGEKVLVFAENKDEAEKLAKEHLRILEEMKSWPRKAWIVRHEVKVRNLAGYEAWIDERARKVSDEDLGIKRYYCYECRKYISSKEVRRHIKKGHEVRKIANPLNAPIKDLDLETYEKTELWRFEKGVVQNLEGERCFYCNRPEKPEFPLISVELYETEKSVKRVKVCAICYYERFGKYKGKNQKVLEIQRNFVVSLRKVNPEFLAKIHNEIREELRRRIELYLKARLSPNQRAYFNRLVEKRLAKLLPRYVIL